MINFLSKIFFCLTVVCFGLLIIIEFFQNINIDKKIMVISVLLFGILSSIFERTITSKIKTAKQSLIISIIIPTALIIYLVLLTILGGSSQSGIGLNNPVVWLMYIATIVGGYVKYKKILISIMSSEKRVGVPTLFLFIKIIV
ncbi:hypothetical protein [Ureibacillus sinduriensis]|uniref:Uncharacterized protein n=1 Tax=Ureibacillus sinduriensis BLB-1 = JCM 15800 TaxID=1384057 RepID=A0A0A3I183_9BACL|nr:hypothetical protein [Ureibacillus sinduriensis]KGR78596.1 hypothetical protein CD33_01015 [Ureibacillus sinduriensis BLB-1 = JCM 15800]